MFAVLSKSDLKKLYNFISIENSWFRWMSDSDIEYLESLSNKTAKYNDNRGPVHEISLIFCTQYLSNLQKKKQNFAMQLRRKKITDDFEDMIKLFSKYCELSLDQVDSKGNTSIHYAVKHNVIRCVSILLKHGASPDIMNENYETPLHLAAKDNLYEISKLLLNYNADTSSQDKEGKTPAHYACENNNEKLVDMLEIYGADFSIKDNDGKTPEDYLDAHIP